MARRMKFRRKVKRRRRTRKSVARRTRRRGSRRARVAGGFRRVSRARAKFGGFLKRGLVGDTVAALGADRLARIVTDRVAPQATPFASIGAEFAAGGVGGMVVAEAVKGFAGEPSILNQLGGIFGGGGAQTQEVAV